MPASSDVTDAMVLARDQRLSEMCLRCLIEPKLGELRDHVIKQLLPPVVRDCANLGLYVWAKVDGRWVASAQHAEFSPLSTVATEDMPIEVVGDKIFREVVHWKSNNITIPDHGRWMLGIDELDLKIGLGKKFATDIDLAAELEDAGYTLAGISIPPNTMNTVRGGRWYRYRRS